LPQCAFDDEWFPRIKIGPKKKIDGTFRLAFHVPFIEAPPQLMGPMGKRRKEERAKLFQNHFGGIN